MGETSWLGEWGVRHRLALDALLAGGIWLMLVPVSAVALGLTSMAMLPAFVLAGLMVVPLAWRRERPAASAILVFSATLVRMFAVSDAVVLPVDFVVVVALWSVTAYGPAWAHRAGVTGAVAGSALLGVLMWSHGYDRSGAFALALLALLTLVTTWAVALVRRTRRETLSALMDRARRLEIERDQQAELGAARERARIAREMHDIVAHSLTVMVAQADGGRYAGQSDPEAATRALGTIAETGRAALVDMRRLLGVLRNDTAAVGAPAEAPVAPMPAADQVAELVEGLRASGLQVSFVRVGRARDLPPGVGLTLYRVAQESLTNVLKHAGPDPAVTVALTWQNDSVVLEVSDDGRGASAGGDGLGQGLRGMAERATMFGGTLSTGPRPGGGFRVRLVLPTPAFVPNPHESGAVA